MEVYFNFELRNNYSQIWQNLNIACNTDVWESVPSFRRVWRTIFKESGGKVKEIGFVKENLQRLLIKNILCQTMTIFFVISQEVENRKDW